MTLPVETYRIIDALTPEELSEYIRSHSDAVRLPYVNPDTLFAQSHNMRRVPNLARSVVG